MERRERFDFRLLNIKDAFYDYIELNKLNRSMAIRHFISQGISGGGLSIEDKKQILDEVIGLKKSLVPIGTNLNQIARYFNQKDKVHDPVLSRNHQEIIASQKQITILLNEVLKKL